MEICENYRHFIGYNSIEENGKVINQIDYCKAYPKEIPIFSIALSGHFKKRDDQDNDIIYEPKYISYDPYIKYRSFSDKVKYYKKKLRIQKEYMYSK